MATFVLVDAPAIHRDRFIRGVRLDEASGVRHAVRHVGGRIETRAALRAAVAPVAVVDPYSGLNLDVRAVTSLCREFPSAGVIAYAAFSERPAQDLLELAHIGVDSALSSGVDDDAYGVRRAILGALRRNQLPSVLGQIQPLLTERGFQLVAEILRRTEKALSVPALASSLGLHRRALERVATAERLPAPSRIIAMCRITHAARLMTDPARSVESVAEALEFADAPTLRKLIKRETSLRPRELVRDGDMGPMITRLCTFLRRDPSSEAAVAGRHVRVAHWHARAARRALAS